MAKKEPNIFIKILQDLDIIQKDECESKKSLGHVVFMSIIIRFFQLFAYTIIFLLLSSHMMWTVKNFNSFNYNDSLFTKPYSNGKTHWLNAAAKKQQGGNPLLYKAAYNVGKAGVKTAIRNPNMSKNIAKGLGKEAFKDMTGSRTRSAGSSSGSSKGLEFPYDLLNGNEFGDWFSRTIAYNQSYKGGITKLVLEFLNKIMFKNDNEKTSIWNWFKTIPIWSVFIVNFLIFGLSFYTGFLSGNFGWWDTIVQTLGGEGMSKIFPNSYSSIFYNLPLVPYIFITTIATFLIIYNWFNFTWFILVKNYFTGEGAKNYFLKHFFQPLTLTVLAFCIALYVTFFAMFDKCVANPTAVKGVCGGFLAFEVLLFVLIIKDEWPNIKSYFLGKK